MKSARIAQTGSAISSPSDEGPARAAASAPLERKRNTNPKCHGAPQAMQALRVIEEEGKAGQYLARLQDQQADPQALALIVSMLYGAALRGFCRVMGKTLGVCHA